MPIIEPITVEETKARLGIRNDARNDEIGRLITAAREHIEDYSERLLARRSHIVDGTGFKQGAPVVLDFGPVHAIETIEHMDADGVITEVEGGRLVNFGGYRILPALGTYWPYGGLGYRITVDAGYDNGDADEDLHVPEKLMQALLLLVGLWFENHEAAVVGSNGSASVPELPFGVRALCAPGRLPGFQ